MCVISIKCALYNFVVVFYMVDEYKESYECLYYQKDDVCFYILYEL